MGSKGSNSAGVRKKKKLNDSTAKNSEPVSSSDSEEVVRSEAQATEDVVDEASSEEENFSKKKQSWKAKHDDGSEAFSSALTNILSSHLKAYDRRDPILARNKKVLKKNEAQKLELKAKRALLAEKKLLMNKSRKRDIVPVAAADEDPETIRELLEKERKLRKIAQKGVVKLFNAILSTQVKTDKEIQSTLSTVKNRNERKELITDVSKERFLDMVKAAGGN